MTLKTTNEKFFRKFKNTYVSMYIIVWSIATYVGIRVSWNYLIQQPFNLLLPACHYVAEIICEPISMILLLWERHLGRGPTQICGKYFSREAEIRIVCIHTCVAPMKIACYRDIELLSSWERQTFQVGFIFL